MIKIDFNRFSPFSTSLLIHSTFVIGFAVSMISPKVNFENVDIEVLDTPKQALSPLQAIAKPTPKPEKRAVFGISRKSVTSDEGLETKQGNTVAKTPDQEKLRDDDADSLPIPTDEYLVSQMPVLITDIRVPYPEEAKKRGVQGAVIFDLLIDSNGNVREAKLLEGPGVGLNEAAASAIPRLKFKPARVEDKPVAVRIRYAYRFVLEK